ncbi:tetratricopeptide repeat protein [Marichromatium bheemlicum]|uniref:Sel1 repeat family protein n=1 Tax=Marichromatium bheemlicum TaxID=365339 RepID=A0ABX1IBP6_9GAMM|nr:sel1 repeat family protein [Marichromatium bheemlicum]NKN33627.1 sel1 repeat family protein [Marichromatium bheemlicum]
MTGLTKRTLWRYIQDGRLSAIREGRGKRTSVPLTEVLALIERSLDAEARALVLAADGGDAEAQCDLALRLLELDRPVAAREWFTRSARAGYADAMCWLARDLLVGRCGGRDDAAGVLWLSQAAAAGSSLAEAMLVALHGEGCRRARAEADLAAVDEQLDAVERRVLTQALRETAAARAETAALEVV